MTLIRTLFAFALCIGTVSSFFDFLKSAATKPERAVEQHLDTNAVRGAPEYLHNKYLTDPFICDGKSFPAPVVNDGFCDCVDKSDEPGTNACGETLFHCINKGYKMIKIPSSRVDDQVCDCCDGSDEGRVANCANTCNEVAEKERALLAKVSTEYKIGSSIRESLIKTVIEEKTQLSASATPLSMELHVLQDRSDDLQVKVDEKQQRITALEGNVASEQRNLVKTKLRLESFDLAELAQFLSSLLKLVKIEGSAVGDLVDPPKHAAAPVTETAEEDDVNDQDDVIPADRFGDDDTVDAYQGEVLDVDAIQDPVSLETEASEIVTAAATQGNSCELVNLTNDDALLPLCHAITDAETTRDLIRDVVQKRAAYNEAMLLLGFRHVSGSFSGSDQFALNHLETSTNTCPASFESIPSATADTHHCSLKDTLPAELSGIEVHFGLPELRAELEALHTQRSEVRRKVVEVENKHKAALEASSELEQHKDQLEYLAMKGQCFDKEDGAFTYSLCILGSITQKEVVGHREVTLGTFQSIEPAYDSPAVNGVVPSVIMRFDRGQHCHAFGARTASVTVSCAAKNALISATEPSTCAYKLHFESPAACTPKYAQISGIAELGLI